MYIKNLNLTHGFLLIECALSCAMLTIIACTILHYYCATQQYNSAICSQIDTLMIIRDTIEKKVHEKAIIDSPVSIFSLLPLSIDAVPLHPVSYTYKHITVYSTVKTCV